MKSTHPELQDAGFFLPPLLTREGRSNIRVSSETENSPSSITEWWTTAKKCDIF
jgi:hypothetical protein